MIFAARVHASSGCDFRAHRVRRGARAADVQGRPGGVLCWLQGTDWPYTSVVDRYRSCDGIAAMGCNASKHAVQLQRGDLVLHGDLSVCYPPQATSAGAKEQEATNHLEKKFKTDPAYDDAECVQAAISALQHVLSEDFKAAEVEVGPGLL